MIDSKLRRLECLRPAVSGALGKKGAIDQDKCNMERAGLVMPRTGKVPVAPHQLCLEIL